METTLLVILTALTLCTLALVLHQARHRTTPDPSRTVPQHATPQVEPGPDRAVQPRAAATASTGQSLDLSRYFADHTLATLSSSDLVIYPTGQHGQVLIFGDRTQANRLGTIVQDLPTALARTAVGADAATRLALAAGEQSGMLVRLTRDSAKAYRELTKASDASGAVLGVLFRNGKFAHVIRFTPAVGLQAIGGVAGALQGIALQAQLASIEKALAEVSSKVDTVIQGMELDRAAHFGATQAVVMEVYRASQATGTLTSAMWQQIAPLAHPVRHAQERARLELQATVESLEGLAGERLKARRTELTRLEQGAFDQAFDRVRRADRVAAQFQALRLWHLIESGDLGLGAYRDELIAELHTQGDFLRRMIGAADTAAREAATHGKVAGILSPFDARHIASTGRSLLESVEAARPSALPADQPTTLERREIRISRPLPRERIGDPSRPPLLEH